MPVVTYFINENLEAAYGVVEVTTKRYRRRFDMTLFHYIEILNLVEQNSRIGLSEGQILGVSGRVAVFGDLHGNYRAAFRLITRAWPIDENGKLDCRTKLIFTGDVVDRGSESLRIVSLLTGLKLIAPDRVFVTRGNHETRSVNRRYGFHDECKLTYGPKGNVCWELINQWFDTLSAAAEANGKVFACHGGIGTAALDTLDRLRNVKKPVKNPKETDANEFHWSDPNPVPGAETLISPNEARRNGYYFNEKAVELFLQKNKYDLVARGHQDVEDGVEFFAGKKLITIFSTNSDEAMPSAAVFDESGKMTIHQLDGDNEKVGQDEVTVYQ